MKKVVYHPLIKLRKSTSSSWQIAIGIFALLCFWSRGGLAQSTLNFQNFTQKEGLSSNYVLAFHQDHLGFMWIGTEGGLHRFDGQHFLKFRYDPEDPETLDDNWAASIHEDRQHNLWIGTEKGIHRLNRTTGKIERVPMIKSGRTVPAAINQFMEDEKGGVWIYSITQGIFKINTSAAEKSQWYAEHIAYEDSLVNLEDRSKRTELLVVNSDKLWFETKSAIISIDITSQQLTPYYLPTIDSTDKTKTEILNSSYLGDGRIILFTETHFFILNIKADIPTIKPLQSIDLELDLQDRSTIDVWDILQDDNGELFITTNRHLYFFNTKSGTLKPILLDQTTDGSFPNLIRFPYKDRQGNYWIGTSGSGFYIGRKLENPFTFYQHEPANPNSVSPGQVRTFSEDHYGNLWLGILNHGLDQLTYTANGHLLKKKSLTHFLNQIKPVPSNRIIKIIQGPEKTLWMATLSHGVVNMDSTGTQFTVFEHRPNDTTSLSANRVWALTSDQQKFIWVGTWLDGLNRIDPRTGTIKRFRHDPNQLNSLINNEVRYLFMDPRGMLWIGTAQGLDRYNPKTNQFTHFKQDPKDPTSLSDNLIWAIFQDSKGNLWVGTNTGLNRLDEATQQFEHFFEKDGLPDNTIYGIVEDDEGILWISTENGLAKQLPPGSTPAFFSLGLADGLATTSFVPKAVLNSSKSDQLFFGSTEGFLSVKPSLLQFGTPQPQFALHALSKFNPYKGDGETQTDYFISDKKEVVKLGYRDQSITITLSDLNWESEKGFRYEYQLIGFNRQWMPLGEDMKVSFTNLSPGRYQLQARAINAENIFSETTELLRFRVYAPWWASWWAYLLYILYIGIFIFIIYRFQLRRQLEKQEAQNLKTLDAFKNELYTNITHEFRTPLTVIRGMIGKINQNPDQWLRKGEKMINRNVDELLNLINQILDLRKLEIGKLQPKMIQADIIPYISYIFESFHSMGAGKDINLAYQHDLEKVIMDYDAEMIMRIVSNLLSNAIKYSKHNGQILLQTKVVPTPRELNQSLSESIQITVKDNGIGIPKDQLPYIFDRFYQADNSSSVDSKTKGTGVGLSLTNELIKLLGGTVKVHSVLDEGSEFFVWLPISNTAPLVSNVSVRQEIPLTNPYPSAEEIETTAEKSLKENLPRLLIVEDNPDIRQYLTACLERHYHLYYAENGALGIEKALEEVPDIIISDVMMPEKDGFELCETLKEDIRTSHIPIVLLTAKSDVESRIVGLKHGADDYLAKPFNEEELLVRMKNLLDIRLKLQKRYQNPYDPSFSKAKPSSPTKEDAFILQLKEIFEKRMADPEFGLDQLSKELFLSRSQLGRKVKALTGKSPAIYLRSLRLLKARQLLLTTEISVKEVAYDVGFSDPSYFSKTYSEEFGESPSNTFLS